LTRDIDGAGRRVFFYIVRSRVCWAVLVLCLPNLFQRTWQVSYVRACSVGFTGMIFVIRIIGAFTNNVFLAEDVADFLFLVRLGDWGA
jgi:hypothetical protein